MLRFRSSFNEVIELTKEWIWYQWYELFGQALCFVVTFKLVEGWDMKSPYNTLNMVMYAETIKNRDVTVAMCYGR